MIESLEKAILLMKDGYILQMNGHIMVSYKDGLFLIKDNNLNMKLLEKDFLELYGNSKFAMIASGNETYIDDTKDDLEYYRWSHK